jgi:hypothetical protein
MNRAAKLMIVAYKAHKRGETTIAQEIFEEAMEDEGAPELMEDIHLLQEAQEELDDDSADELDDMPEEDELDQEFTEETKSKLMALANKIAATDGGANRDIARRLRKLL